MSFFANNAGWPLTPLKDVAHLKRGYDLPTHERVEGDTPIFAANGKNGTHNEAKIKGPGVVTGRSGTIGKVHFTEHDYWPLNTALYVTDFKGNDPKWVYYMLQAFKLERFVEGAGVPTLNRNLVHDELIPLPPLAEQKRIAAILDKADAIRRKRQQAIQLADDFLRAVFLEMFGDPVTNPKGWEVMPMQKLIKIQGGYAFKSEEFSESGVPVVKIGNANKVGFTTKSISFIQPDNPHKLKQYELYAGDLLMSLTGTVGKDDYANITEVTDEYDMYYLNQRVAKISVLDDQISKNFIKYFLAHPKIKSEITKNNRGVRQANIGNADIYELSVPVPSNSTLDKFDVLVEQTSSLITKIDSAPDQIDLFFSALSQKAFSGQL